jgi:cell division protein FtsB
MRTIKEHFFHERNNLVTRQTERTLTFFQHYIITHSVWNVTPLNH